QRPAKTMLGVPGHILRGLEEYVTRKDHEVLANPLPTDDALLIHEEECPLCYHIPEVWVVYFPDCAIEHAITPCHLQAQVAEQGVGQFEGVGECLLGKG